MFFYSNMCNTACVQEFCMSWSQEPGHLEQCSHWSWLTKGDSSGLHCVLLSHCQEEHQPCPDTHCVSGDTLL